MEIVIDLIHELFMTLLTHVISNRVYTLLSVTNIERMNYKIFSNIILMFHG